MTIPIATSIAVIMNMDILMSLIYPFSFFTARLNTSPRSLYELNMSKLEHIGDNNTISPFPAASLARRTASSISLASSIVTAPESAFLIAPAASPISMSFFTLDLTISFTAP